MRFAFPLILALVLSGMACGQELARPGEQVTEASAAQSTATPRPTAPSAISSTGPLITVEHGQGVVGDVVPLEVIYYQADAGVAGFFISASVADPEIAEIKGVRLPDYGLSEVGALPSSSVSVAVADIEGLFESAFARETLLTLDVELLKPGDTRVEIDVRMFDDDNGNSVSLDAMAGDLMVMASIPALQ